MVDFSENNGFAENSVFAGSVICRSLQKRFWNTHALRSFIESWRAKKRGLLNLATWQAWFGQAADYEATRQQAVGWGAGTKSDYPAESAAKAFCLRPSADSALLAQALALAQRAVELGKSNTDLPWFWLGLGLAEYRNGRYPEAEQTLKLAEQTAVPPVTPEDCARVKQTAQLLRSMVLFRQQRVAEARQLFHETEAQMPPLPTDESTPLAAGKPVDLNMLIEWMFYKEARALLYETTTKP